MWGKSSKITSWKRYNKWKLQKKNESIFQLNYDGNKILMRIVYGQFRYETHFYGQFRYKIGPKKVESSSIE